MIPETFAYTLTLNGRYAGSQEWVVRPDQGNIVVRVQTEFAGALPAGRKVQESRIQARTGFSLAYAEAEGTQRRPQFETTFDESAGLVTLRQGKDEASLPLLEGHHDPLSLLLWLRTQTGWPGLERRSGDQSFTRRSPDSVRLVGGRVHLQVLPEISIQGREARVYFLRPGGAYVYVEQAGPHRLLRLLQPSDFGPVEALLTLERPGSSPQQAASQEPAGAGGVREPVRPARSQPERSQPGKPRRRR